MILNYVLVGVPAIMFITLGISCMIFPRVVLKWIITRFLPVLFWPADRVGKLLGVKSNPYEYTARARDLVFMRLLGVWFILVPLLFLAAVLGFFK